LVWIRDKTVDAIWALRMLHGAVCW